MKFSPWSLVVLCAALAACSYDSSGVSGQDGSVGVADSAVPSDADAAPATLADAAPDAAIDANMSLPPDAAAGTCGASCNFAGGSCVGDVCTITCGGLNLCLGGVTCPPGVSCNVTCTGTSACSGGVTCSGPKCTVKCNGTSACGQGVDCTGPSCKIECRGDNACELGACCGPPMGGGNGMSCGPACMSSMGGCCQCGGC